MNQIISAKIKWKNQENEIFIKGKYSRTHIWKLENGNQINASSSPHVVPIPYSNPEYIDPEEAFVCSLASCHMLFFLSIAAKKKINVLEYCDNPIGILAKDESNQIAMTEIILRPKVITFEEIDKNALEKIHQLAHKNCFIAKSVKSKIQIKQQ